MNLPPRKPKFSIHTSHRSAALRGPGEPDLAIPVGGARVGSVARPVEDGAANNHGLRKPRFVLRAHASSLQTVSDRPSGPIRNGSDGEVA